MVGAAREIVGRVRRYFGAQIWRVTLDDLPRHRAIAYHASRVAYAAVRGFFENGLMTRAAALTYYSALSVVPLLAFAFAILKGFGAYRSFIDGTVRPYLLETFAANPALLEAMERILRFVDQTDVSRLGTLALVFLLYTSVALISSVEEALNGVFGAKSQRSFLRQLTDYTTLLVTAPLLVVVATTLSTAAQSSSLVAFLRDRLALGAVIDFVVGLAPLVAVGLAFFAIYVILPNVRIRPLSALLGAAVGALLWQGALVLHVRSQLGVARYNALYSGLGAIPIFLVWTYVSWMVVLSGAQLAASHQNERVARQRFRARRADQALREMLAVAVGAMVTRDFLDGGPRRDAAALAALLEVPPQLVEEVLEALVRAGMVARAVCGSEIGYVPGKDIDAVGTDELRQAVRRDPGAEEVREDVAGQLGPGLAPILRAVEGGDGASRGVTLRKLAAAAGSRGDRRPPPPPPGARPDREDRGDGGREPIDPKQPDLPA
jgi:membrane protein